MQTHKIIPQFVPYWDEREKRAVLDILDGDMLLEHKVTRKFEEEFARFVGAKYCVTCTSGTMALWLASMAIKELGFIDDKYTLLNIAIPDLHSIFLYNALKLTGVKTIKVKDHDVDVDIPIHVNGRYYDTEHSLIEDSCQAIDTHTKYRLSCYSFASSKHLTTLGQGGAVCCDVEEEYEMLVSLKDHGRTDRAKLKPMSDTFNRFGINLKFTEAQAAFGLVQLSKLPKRLERLNEMYKVYRDLLPEEITMLDEAPKWYIDIYLKDRKTRDYLHERLKEYGIGSRIYNKPLHRQPFLNYPDNAYPNACYYADHGLFLPSTTNLDDEDIKYICQTVKQLYNDIS